MQLGLTPSATGLQFARAIQGFFPRGQGAGWIALEWIEPNSLYGHRAPFPFGPEPLASVGALALHCGALAAAFAVPFPSLSLCFGAK